MNSGVSQLQELLGDMVKSANRVHQEYGLPEDYTDPKILEAATAMMAEQTPWTFMGQEAGIRKIRALFSVPNDVVAIELYREICQQEKIANKLDNLNATVYISVTGTGGYTSDKYISDPDNWPELFLT